MATPTTTTKTTKATSTTAGSRAASATAAQKAALARYMQLEQRFRPQQFGQFMREMGALNPDYTGNIMSEMQMRRNASGQVQASLAPQLANIRGLYERRSKIGSDAIRNLTDSYTGRVADWSSQIASRNQASLAEAQGMNAALADFTRNYNGSMQGDLNAALTGMNASAGLTAETAGANAALGNTAAVNTAALGTSTAQRMAQEAMAANTYAGLQPAFAAAEGGRNLGMFQSDLNAGMREDIGDITARMPELVLSVYQNLVNQNQQTRQMKQQRGETMTSAYNDMNTRNLNAAIAQAAMRENAARMQGQSADSWLSAMTSLVGTETAAGKDGGVYTPGKLAAGTMPTVMESFSSNPRIFDRITGSVQPWAKNHPGLVRKQIENAIKVSAGTPLPVDVVRQTAISIMQQMGLPTVLPKKKATASTAPTAAPPPGVEGPTNPFSGMAAAAPATYGEGWWNPISALLPGLWG